MISGYDPRCEKCHHYPWTDFFINKHYPHYANPSFSCPCECHNTKREKKNMRFSRGKAKYRIYVEKLAICPFCKRSEFEDAIFYKFSSSNYSSPVPGLPNEYGDFRGIGLCHADHEHDWTLCRCGRATCKISFRQYFGYDMDEELFDNTLVDDSNYTEKEKLILDTDEFERGRTRRNWDGSIDETEINPKEIPVFHTMETVDKVWGKLPRDRDKSKWGPWSSHFYHLVHREFTRPKTYEILEMSDILWTPEDLAKQREANMRYWDREEVLGVKGIGEKTGEKLLKKFKTADGVFSATEKQISKISGLSKRANLIWRYLDSYNKTREKKSE